LNGVKDFTACAQYMASPDSLLRDFVNDAEDERNSNTFIAAKAFSAGGVVVGASVNEIPELFQAASLTNAFLDVMGSMSNASLHLTEHEWDEFGDPRDKSSYSSIARYCPLMNVKRQGYPAMLLVGTVDDENVPFQHALSFGRKVRDNCDSGQAGILLNIEREGGHHLHGKSLEVSALEVSFILCQYSKWLKKE